jgi:L-fuculose-phosphate aldolase
LWSLYVRHLRQRSSLIEIALAMNAGGLNHGTAGNVSVRVDSGFLLTPTGIPYESLAPNDIVEMDFSGRISPGQLKPSSEWRFHRDLYAARAEVNAIVHVHSSYATVLACNRREIPAFHYMVAVAGGKCIPCADYATFGTQALSDKVIATLQGYRACLLANHGMIAVGESPERALRLAREVEELARQYCLSLSLGGPILLDDAEMDLVLEKFSIYGRQDVPEDDR